MVASSKLQQATPNDRDVYNTQIQRTRYDWDERSLCRFAEALRPRPNRFYDSTMNMYLLGALSINSVSHIIHHNNMKHQCTTAEQVGRFVVIMDGRKIFDEYYNTSIVLGQVINAVARLEELELRKRPTPPCNYANHGAHQFDFSR